MQRRSYGVVRVVLAAVLIGGIELWAQGHTTWPWWARYAAYGAGVVLVRRLIPRPDWPSDDDPDDEPPDEDAVTSPAQTSPLDGR